MITRNHLASRWRALPPDSIETVTLFERESGSFYDANKPYIVAVANPRPVSKDDESYFEGIEATSRRRTFCIWAETVSAPWDSSFNPLDIEIDSEWIVRDEKNNEWMVVSATSSMLETHWKLVSYLIYGESIIDV